MEYRTDRAFSTTPLALTPVRMRSGQAARLAGIPVATLRVWERRYGAVDAPKTQTGQRLYAPGDLQRLQLLKQLTARGHAIGTIAALEMAALQALAEGSGAPRVEPARQAVVVGRTAAQRLRRFAACVMTATYDDLDLAEAATSLPDAEVLVVRLETLQPETVERVLALHDRLPSAALLVLYAYGTEAVAQALRSAGATVRREQVSGHELARLVTGTRAGSAALPDDLASAQAAEAARRPIAPRRFSDEALTELTELSSSVACECPRHMAEIVMQLAAFERYSSECVSRGPEDAALHRELAALAGSTRTLFEVSLEQLVIAEGLQRP